jgi:carboxypeptidase T
MRHRKPICLAIATLALASAMPITTALAADSPEQIRQMQEQEKAATNFYKAYFPNLDMAHKAAISFHDLLQEANYESGYLVLELGAQDMVKLRKFGFKLQPATEFIQQRKKFLEAMQADTQQQALRSATPSAAAALAPATIPGYTCYETVEETFSQAQAFATNQPSLATWADVGDTWEKTAGLGGFDISVLKITNSAIAGPKPKLFVNSAIHAREYTTAPLNLEFARWLLNGYGTNADATWIVDHHEVHLMLQSNPDGRKKAETGLAWRKNANQAYCGATSNTRGADLNRNFSFSFNSTGGQGSSGAQCDLTYRGASAASEPEVQALEAYVRSLWPDQRGPNVSDAAPSTTSGMHIDVHSQGRLVLWPWGTTTTPTGNGNELQRLGRKLAFFNNHTPKQSIGLYPTDGTSDSVSYGELGVAAFTIELGTAHFETCTYYNSSIKTQNLNALIYAAKVVRTPYITPAGPDVTTVTLSGTAATTGVQVGSLVTLNGSATDIRYNNVNGTEATQNIAAAEYYIDTPPWLSGAVASTMVASDGAFNAKTEGIRATINTAGLSIGKHTVFVRSRDALNNWGPISAIFLKVNP